MNEKNEKSGVLISEAGGDNDGCSLVNDTHMHLGILADDEKCFKTPTYLPPRKSPGRRKMNNNCVSNSCNNNNNVIRNGLININNVKTMLRSIDDADSVGYDNKDERSTSCDKTSIASSSNNEEASRKRISLSTRNNALSPSDNDDDLDKEVDHPNSSDNSLSIASTSCAFLESASCSNCSEKYLRTNLLSVDKLIVGRLKEVVIDDFSLILFDTIDHFNEFKMELDAEQAKKQLEERRRIYENNVRLGLMKKKGRKSKAEKEEREERNRIKLKAEAEFSPCSATIVDFRRPHTNFSLDTHTRLINNMRCQKSEFEQRQLSFSLQPLQPASPLSARISLSNLLTPTSNSNASGISIENFNSIRSMPCMNEQNVSVCTNTSSSPHIANTKRGSDSAHNESLAMCLPEKRLKIGNQEQQRNGLIGISPKTDSSAVLSSSPPRIARSAVLQGGNGVHSPEKINSSIGSLGVVNQSGAIAWTGPSSTNVSNLSSQSRPLSTSVEQRANSSSASLETTHPVDPGQDLPSTSSSLTASAPIVSSVVLNSGNSMGVNSAVLLGNSDALMGRGVSPVDSRSASTGHFIDPLRHVFFNGAGFAASLNGNAVGSNNFGGLFLQNASSNAAALPYITAAQILQHQQQQQQVQQTISLSQSVASSSSAITSQPTTTTNVIGSLQFPTGAALGPQLAGAAFLGRTLPTAVPLSQSSLSNKAKQGRWCALHVKIAYDIVNKKKRSNAQPVTIASSQNSTSTRSGSSSVTPSLCIPSTSSQITGLNSGLSNSFSTIAAVNALQSPFNTISFQQLAASADANKYVRQTSPKQLPSRSTPAAHRAMNASASGMQLQLSNSGVLAPPLQLSTSMHGIVGASLPLTQTLPPSGSITSGTSDAAAQAAMFAALAQNVQQSNAAAAAQSTGLANQFVLPSQQPSSLSAMAASNTQSQSLFPIQRLFDPSMAMVLQQMQSMEAMRQSAVAQMNIMPSVSASTAPPPSAVDLMRLQLEQQMMDRYVALGGTSAAAAAAISPNVDIMRQQLLAAQIRQQQQQQQQQQPSLEALIELQRQQQQQQLLNASRALPAAYSLGGTAGNLASSSAAGGASGIPQVLAGGLFNPGLMPLSGSMAASLQQSFYHKNPYSNTLEQLARQKRDSDVVQSGR